MSRDMMRPKLRELILAALPRAQWHYDEDADEMVIAFSEREGRLVLSPEDDFYVRIDANTGEPLGIFITAWSHWLATRRPQAVPPVSQQDTWQVRPGALPEAARDTVTQTVQASGYLSHISVLVAST